MDKLLEYLIEGLDKISVKIINLVLNFFLFFSILFTLLSFFIFIFTGKEEFAVGLLNNSLYGFLIWIILILIDSIRKGNKIKNDAQKLDEKSEIKLINNYGSKYKNLEKILSLFKEILKSANYKDKYELFIRGNGPSFGIKLKDGLQYVKYMNNQIHIRYTYSGLNKDNEIKHDLYVTDGTAFIIIKSEYLENIENYSSLINESLNLGIKDKNK